MPIKKENRALYPQNWKELRDEIFSAYGYKCAFCGVHDGDEYIRKRDGKHIRHKLTLAHLYDDNPANCSPDNLVPLCCFCHNRLDAPMRAKHRAKTIADRDKSLFIDFKD